MHSRNFRRILSAVLCLVLCVSVLTVFDSSAAVTSAAEYTDAKVKSMEVSISKIEEKIKAKKSELSSISSDQKDAEEEAELIEEQIALTEEKITATEDLLKELDSQIAEKLVEIEEKTADIDLQFQRFKDRVRIAYEEGESSYIEMVFGSESISDFLSRLEYINSMLEYDNRLMKDYQSQRSELVAEKEQLEAAQNKQKEYAESLEAEKAALESDKERVETIRANLRTQYAEAWAEYSKQKEEEEKLSKELEAYIKEMQEKNKKAYVGGEFIWPVDITFSRVSSEFGSYRYLWGYWDGPHTGMDIPCTLNSPVYASNSGTVIKAEMHWSYGNYIIIDHGGGKATLYAHNNKLNCKVGDEVKQGQVIAYAGTTGSSTGVHCHFEYRVDGVRQDPRLVVVAP